MLSAKNALSEFFQVYEDPESQEVLSEWLAERDSLRFETYQAEYIVLTFQNNLF